MSEWKYFSGRVDRGFEEVTKGVFSGMKFGPKPKMVVPTGAKHAKPRPKASKKEDQAFRGGFQGEHFQRQRPASMRENLDPFKPGSKEGVAYGRGRAERTGDTANLAGPGKHVDYKRRDSY